MAATVQPSAPPREGMTWIADGAFDMGSEDFYPEERPVRRVSVRGFWIDTEPVTVARFRRFVKATRYVTVPAARQGEAIDTSTSHIGFRCVIRA
jgi:formylglycine-generating enzyme